MTTPDSDSKSAKDSPFRLNRSRITLLLLIVLALISIVGALTGGLTGYQELREGTLELQAQ
jgi:hypothetical protein